MDLIKIFHPAHEALGDVGHCGDFQTRRNGLQQKFEEEMGLHLHGSSILVCLLRRDELDDMIGNREKQINFFLPHGFPLYGHGL